MGCTKKLIYKAGGQTEVKEENTEYELLKIGELAAMAGISPKALRVYERMKIIVPVKVDEETGYRYYSADQVKQVDALLEWKELGFTLKEVKKIFSKKNSMADIEKIMDAKKKEWQENIWKAEQKIDTIEELRQKLEAGKEKLEELSDEERAWYLVKMSCISDSNQRNALSEAIWL